MRTNDSWYSLADRPEVQAAGSLGPKWGQMGKSAAKLTRLQPLIELIAKIGAKTPGGLKKALKAHPDEWVELIEKAKDLRDVLGADGGEPNVMLIDLPYLGGGTEAPAFDGVATYEAPWESG